MLMSIYNLAALLLTLTTIEATDLSNYFTYPEDASNDPTNYDPSQNPAFTLGSPQVITWTSDAVAVQLILNQEGGDEDVLCITCSGGIYRWNGQITQDFQYGDVFSLWFQDADDPGSGKNSTSRYFNITGGPSKPSVTPFLPPDTSSPTHAPPSSTSPSSSNGKPISNTSSPESTNPSPQVNKASSSTFTASIPPPESPTSINTSPTQPGAVPPTRTTDSSPSLTLNSVSTSLPAVQSNQSKTSASPLKIGVGIGSGIFSAAVLIAGLFFFLRRRRSQQPVRANSPPPWSPGTDAVVPETKGPHQRYDRVETEVPNSPNVKSPIPGAEPGNAGFSKAELPPETCEKGMDDGGGPRTVEDPIGVELP